MESDGKTNCYEASAGCACRREDCGGVRELLSSCPIHGLNGPEVMRLHGCDQSASIMRVRMMAARRIL